MNVVPIFINFLANETLKIDNASLEKYCLQSRKNSPGRVVSNGGGWQSNNLDLAAPELRELLGEVTQKLNELHRYFALSESMQQTVIEAWVNINNRGHFNYSHTHPGCFFSCVYYVNGGSNKGNIEFETPIEAHGYTIRNQMVTAFNAFTGNALSIPPVTGDLIIFPAWLNHRVRMNETDEDRISIALNSAIVPKNR